jgi:hypothetical protein
MSGKVEVRVDRSPSHCPYCKGELGADLAAIVGCAACGARHHRDCHAENDARCATCGSVALLAPVAETLHRPVFLPVVSREAIQPMRLPVAGETVPTRWQEEEMQRQGLLIMALCLLGVLTALFLLHW